MSSQAINRHLLQYTKPNTKNQELTQRPTHSHFYLTKIPKQYNHSKYDVLHYHYNQEKLKIHDPVSITIRDKIKNSAQYFIAPSPLKCQIHNLQAIYL